MVGLARVRDRPHWSIPALLEQLETLRIRETLAQRVRDHQVESALAESSHQVLLWSPAEGQQLLVVHVISSAHLVLN